MAVTTADALLQLLERSNLLDAEQLAQAGEEARQAADARSLAKALVGRGWLTRWQAGQLLAGRAAFFLGKYKLIEPLGGRGMGRVFLAEHTRMGRTVALKILPKRLSRDPALSEQFLTEARAIAALDHPNIVHPYDVASEGDRYYLAMEYVEGRDLERLVAAEGPLAFSRAARYIQQAAEGLAHVHSRDMIHCEIQPANLLVNKQDVVKILDTGMGRLARRGDAQAPEGQQPLPHAADYLAPELAGENPEVDRRADIYGLGCTFYFLLTGQPPFPGESPQPGIAEHGRAEPRPISDLRPDAPQTLVALCEKMMAHDPAERFQSADEVSRALAEWLATEGDLEAIAAAVSESATGTADGAVKVEAAPAWRVPGTTPGLFARAWQAVAARPRRALLASLGALAALAVVAGVTLWLLGFYGPAGRAPGPQTRATGGAEPIAKAAARPDEKEPQSDFPELPDVGNLRDFDPGAIMGVKTGEADKAGAQVKSESGPSKSPPQQEVKAEPSSSRKAPQEKLSPEKPQPEKPESGKPAPEQVKPAEKTAQPQETGKPEPAAKSAERPPEKPAEKPQFEDPLRELAESVELPELETGPGKQAPGALAIAPIRSKPEVPWQLFLLGGDTAGRRNCAFVLKKEQTETAKASWLVELETSASGTKPGREPVARLWREGEALQFQWAQGAPSTANYLRNCVLQVRVEGKSKYVALAQPKTLQPIPIDLERGVAKANLPLKWLPEAGTLRVEITKVEGHEGHQLNPPGPVDPKKPIEISFPRTDRNGNTPDGVALRLDFTIKTGGIRVKLQLIEPQAKYFAAFQTNAAVLHNRLETARDAVTRQLSPADPNKAPRGEERSRLLIQLDGIEHDLWYVDFYSQVQGKAAIHFRLLLEVDGRQVVLATT